VWLLVFATNPPFPRPPAVFAPVSIPGVDLLLPKLTYIAINLVGVGIIMYKFQSMGLLPITSADWVSLLPERHPAEFSSLGVPLS